MVVNILSILIIEDIQDMVLWPIRGIAEIRYIGIPWNMKKKLFKELTKSIKQAGEIRKKRNSNMVCGYYVSWSEKIIVPDGIGPGVRTEWEQHISGPHSEVEAKEIVDGLRSRGGNYAKNILGLHYDALAYVNHSQEEKLREATDGNELQRCNNCDAIFDENLQACPKCGRDDCLMYPFENSN